MSRALFKELGGEANVVYLSHDHYYKDISHKTLEERSQTNFDHPDSLDTMLLVEHIRHLKDGKVVDLPTYDFTTHSRTPVTTHVHPKRIILVEGILIFTSPELCSELDMKVFVVSFFKVDCSISKEWTDEKISESSLRVTLPILIVCFWDSWRPPCLIHLCIPLLLPRNILCIHRLCLSST